MLKSLKAAFLLIFIALLLGAGEVWGQTYTTTGNSTDWNNAAAWVRTGNCGAINNGGPPPPLNLNSGNACPVKIIVNHPINYSGSATIGGGYMDSLIVNTGGNLTFTGNVTVNSAGNSTGPFSFTIRGGGILNVGGNFTNQNTGTSIRVQSAGQLKIGGNYVTAGTSSSVNIDSSSAMAVVGSTTINSNHSLVVSGTLSTNTLSTGGGGTVEFNNSSNITVFSTLTHSNGTITLSNTANLFIGNNLDMTGSAILNLSGDTDIKVSGNLNLSNGAINNSGNGDIRVGGNFSMAGGGTYNGSGNSYVGASGNHNISSYNPVNLSEDSKFFVEGNRSGGMGGSIASSACYRAQNASSGNGVCLPCSEAFNNVSAASFHVPPGVTSITIEAWGGGGAGGSIVTNSFSGAGGGGGGGYARSTIAVSEGETFGIYTGVAGSTTTSSFSNGGDTYITRDSNLPISSAFMIARGGKSVPLNTKAGGLGGGASSTPANLGDFVSIGGTGATGTSDGGGGGSSGGSSSAIGNNGSVTAGGAAPTSGYVGGVGAQSGDGTASIAAYAGGGGGADANNSTDRIGGQGKPGFVRISYSCPTSTACSRYLDYGTSGDFVVLEYFCTGVWNAPEGLAEFGVTLIGGGGGGGYGNAAGGGGGGGVFSTPKSGDYTDINKKSNGEILGLPSGTVFTIDVGDGGKGASAASASQKGLSSSLNGYYVSHDGSLITFSPTAPGGGGGGSAVATVGYRDGTSNSIGSIGASGGGGAYYGSAGNGGSSLGSNAHAGANGIKPASDRNPIAGGGGGGAGSAGYLGSGSGNGQSDGGNGGAGITLSAIPGSRPALSGIFGAGGGGTAFGASNTNNNTPGTGGSGVGGAARHTGTGYSGTANTGSGGGAGYTGGGDGGSGKVYIYYAVYRILEVEYLDFDASYRQENRSGKLSWSTAKEWQNSHFEIERAVNSVANWETIGSVDGAGYSDTALSYTFDDDRLPASGGNIFYRLKQVNLDGTFSYSVTRAIQVEAVEGSGFWTVYPNPSQGHNVQLATRDGLPLTEETSLQVSLVNTLGQAEFISGQSLEEINQQLRSQLSRKTPGHYLLVVQWGSKMETLRIIKL